MLVGLAAVAARLITCWGKRESGRGRPVYYTQGFNPHIYLSFTCPLSLGQESLCESCEVKTEQETIDPQAWIDALQP